MENAFRLVSRGFKSQNGGVWTPNPKFQERKFDFEWCLLFLLKNFGSLTYYGSTDVK
jgi:hypothetical protein